MITGGRARTRAGSLACYGANAEDAEDVENAGGAGGVEGAEDVENVERRVGGASVPTRERRAPAALGGASYCSTPELARGRQRQRLLVVAVAAAVVAAPTAAGAGR